MASLTAGARSACWSRSLANKGRTENPTRRLALSKEMLVGMVIGMATTKITVTLQNEQIEEIRALVSAGATPNISAFVQHAVRIALHDAAGWRELLRDAMEQTGGPLTKKERALADGIFRREIRKKSSRRGKAA